jgi:DNA polymerase type B, organellar and viral
VDRFVRKSYFGGHTDIYKKYIKKGKYYDINSLYPFAMLKPMPNQLRQIHKNMNNINLNDFFGFIKCEIITPDNILKPILPYKDVNSNRTIYPIGH